MGYNRYFVISGPGFEFWSLKFIADIQKRSSDYLRFCLILEMASLSAISEELAELDGQVTDIFRALS